VLLIGTSGTGKSTILKSLREFFPPDQVGVLSNNIERQWAMSSLIDKYVVLGYEIKANLKWDQAEFQQCVACEELQVFEKHKTAYMRSWNTPIFMAANEMIKCWRDTAGSLKRRLLIIPFRTFIPPNKVNPNLQKELKKEFSIFLQKINAAYQQTTARYVGKDIWDILPKFLKDASNDAMKSLHPLQVFLIIIFGY
jgi:phage/plasmid-associated DNA primase